MKIAPIPVVALVALGMVAVPMVAQAQAQQQQQQKQMQPQNAPANFSDQELKSFVQAALEVQQINQTYGKRLQNAETPENQQAVRKEATGKMVQAIEEEGLTVEKYNAISKAAKTDSTLAQKVRKHIQEAR